MRQSKPFIGRKFGRLTVLRALAPDGMFLCRCVCGNEVELFRSQLVDRVVVHCGCEHRASRWTNRKIPLKYFHQRGFRDQTKIHRNTRERCSYASMKQRCLNPKSPGFADWGGRGITVCARWLEPNGQGFRNFLDDMGPRPLGKTLDRINVNGNYEPTNCRWADAKDQTANRRNMLPDLPPLEPEPDPWE